MFYKQHFPKQEDGSENADLTEMQFVKVIDIFEKLVFVGTHQNKKDLTDGFYRIFNQPCPPNLSTMAKIPISALETIFNFFWYDAHGSAKD